MAEKIENEGSGNPPQRPPPPKKVMECPKTPPSSVRQHLEHLQALPPSKVRWFYLEDKSWLSFNGTDSLKIENVFR